MHPWVAEGDTEVRFAIQGGGSSDWPEIRDFVQAINELGFDAYFRPDHPMLTPDSWTILAAVANATRRIRLGTSVTLHPLPQPGDVGSRRSGCGPHF